MKTVSEMKKRTELQVAKNAAKEYEEFIKSAMEHNMALLEEFVKEDGRKRIAKRDVIRLFSKQCVRSADNEPKWWDMSGVPRLIDAERFDIRIDRYSIPQFLRKGVYPINRDSIVNIHTKNSNDISYLEGRSRIGEVFDLVLIYNDNLILLVDCTTRSWKYRNGGMDLTIDFRSISTSKKLIDEVLVELKDRSVTIDAHIYISVKRNHGDPKEMLFDDFCKYAVIESI